MLLQGLTMDTAAVGFKKRPPCRCLVAWRRRTVLVGEAASI